MLLTCLILTLWSILAGVHGQFPPNPFDRFGGDDIVQLRSDYPEPDYFPADDEPRQMDFEENSPIFTVEQDASWPSKEVYSKLGQISASAVDAQNPNTIFILHRSDRVWNERSFDQNNVFSGKRLGAIKNCTLAHIGNGHLKGCYLKNALSLPHGLSVDGEGNFWITDIALHQVLKFGRDLSSKPLLVLGEPYVPGADESHFCKPTHVEVASTGDFFVADGYCNSRIMKFDRNGKLLTYWGQKPRGPGIPTPYELDIPHELALIEEADMICVADRENWRVVCFSAGLRHFNAGEFLFQLGTDGPAYGVAYAPHEELLFVLVGSTSGDVNEGAIPGVQIFHLPTRDLIETIQDFNGTFRAVHSLAACRSRSEPGCLVISSSEPPGHASQRLWLYHLADGRSQDESDLPAMR